MNVLKLQRRVDRVVQELVLLEREHGRAVVQQTSRVWVLGVKAWLNKKEAGEQ